MTTDDNRGVFETRVQTGVPGLDRVVGGGYIPGRSYMIRGKPGAGKTLAGVHFLLSGDPADALFVNLGEPEHDVKRDAENFGLDLDGVAFLDLSPSADSFTESQSYDIFPADEVETGGITERIVDAVREHEPERVFVDPMTQFRYLAPDDYQFREQVLSFLQFLKEEDCTTLFTSQNTAATPDDDLQFMSDGIVHLDHDSERRNLRVTKFRGSEFEGGDHAVRISDDGMRVYPRLRPDEYQSEFDPASVPSGIPEMDALLHGGLERGTVSIISGPSGVGKTTTGAQFMKEAAGRGERSVIYMFEESEQTFLQRCSAINIPVEAMIERGTLELKEIEALERSAPEFANDVRYEVEENGADIVMIDGIQGYRLAVHGEEEELTNEIHALGRYLKNMGVTTILVSEIADITGQFQATEVNVSYIADNIVFLRYLEFDGELRKAIGVLKKRASDFERNLREYEITQHGIRVGDQLTNLQGILSGTPEWTDDDEFDERD
ncbi:ATPase domain-containing protein [Halocalculus aciditolerans]|uniref:non-specific serine/threonine protein kinase n=1 Tax=Halocalculus aciditolerans TaxID=1383812 RepID=A0A830FIV5_9EURY|nr:ATPase domain-containing protein [Halocalculus aciditolerans]GGL57151.1 serine/threonine protein kinase [Halocalculus aciditolerans]